MDSSSDPREVKTLVAEMLATGEARRLREAARLMQKEVAHALGVSNAAVCQYERGRRKPSAAVALRYAELLAAWGADV